MQPGDFMFLMLAAISAFVVSFLILPVLIKYSLKKNIVAVPDRRRPHKKETPSLGGVAIFIGFLLASLMWIDLKEWTHVRYPIACLLIIFFLGIRDDLVPFNAWRKMVGQMAAVVGLLFSPITINSLYGLFDVNEIPMAIGFILTAGFIIIITNAYNLIDGLDGLAGTIALVSFTAYGLWFHLVDEQVFSLLCFSMAGAMLAFLIFNWEPAEIFMGDTGAMVGGMLLSIVTIYFMNVNYALPDYHIYKFASTVGAAACLIVVPLCDTVRIIILRLARGQSPIKADKSHIHHGLVRIGFTHAKAALSLGLLSALFITAAFLFRNYSDKYVLPLVILICSILSITLDRMLIKKLNRESAEEG